MAGNVFFYFSVNEDHMKDCFYFNDIFQIYHLSGKHTPDHANFENG